MSAKLKHQIQMAVIVASAFGLGMWFMYMVMWSETFDKLITMAEKVFK